jgi:hypothetical protein
MFSFECKGLVDNYLTELSSLAKRLCPEARIEATTEASKTRTAMFAFTRPPV